MPDVKFVMSADAAELLRADEQIMQSQADVAKGFQRLAIAGEQADQRLGASAAKLAVEYQLAERSATNALSFRGTSAPLLRAKSYALAPAANAPAEPNAIAQYAGEALELADPRLRVRQWAQENPHLLGGGDPHTARLAAQAVARQVSERGDARRAEEAKSLETARLAEIDRGANLEADLHLIGLQKKDADKKVFRQRVSKGLDTAFTVATIAGAASVAYLESYEQRMQSLGDTTVRTNDEMRQLLSMGDNALHPVEVRNAVLSRSSGLGIDSGQIAAAMTEIERGMQGASQPMKDSALQAAATLQRVAGGSLESNVGLMTKAFEAFGTSGDVLAGKLLETRKLGGAGADEFLTQLPKILPEASSHGISLDETLALTSTASQFGGSDRKVFSGIAELFQKINGEQKEGVVLSGTLQNRLEQLGSVAKSSPEIIQKMFPESGGVLLKLLADHSRELADNFQRIKAAGADNLLSAAASQLTDQVMAAGHAIEVFRQISKNSDASKLQNPETRGELVLGNAIKAGAKLNADATTPDWLIDARATAARWVAPSGELASEGVHEAIRKARAAGDSKSADYWMLQFGKITQTSSFLPGEPNRHGDWAGPDDAEEFAGLGKDYNLGLRDFLNLQYIRRNRANQEVGFLFSHRRPDFAQHHPEQVLSEGVQASKFFAQRLAAGNASGATEAITGLAQPLTPLSGGPLALGLAGTLAGAHAAGLDPAMAAVISKLSAAVDKFAGAVETHFKASAKPVAPQAVRARRTLPWGLTFPYLNTP